MCARPLALTALGLTFRRRDSEEGRVVASEGRGRVGAVEGAEVLAAPDVAHGAGGAGDPRYVREGEGQVLGAVALVHEQHSSLGTIGFQGLVEEGPGVHCHHRRLCRLLSGGKGGEGGEWGKGSGEREEGVSWQFEGGNQ